MLHISSKVQVITCFQLTFIYQNISAHTIENALQIDCTCTARQLTSVTIDLPYNVCGLLRFVYQIIVNIFKMCHFLSCLIHAVQIMVAPCHMTFMTGDLCEQPVPPGKSLSLCPTKVLCASNNINRLLKIPKSHQLITNHTKCIRQTSFDCFQCNLGKQFIIAQEL